MNSRIKISIQGQQNVINISKGAVRILGAPTHICLLINESMSSIAIMPCDSSDVMSFSVPNKLLYDRNCSFRICSKQFVKKILSANDLNENSTYTIPGHYLIKQNAIVFKIKEAI